MHYNVYKEAHPSNVMFKSLNTTLFALFSERRCGRVVTAAEKLSGNAAEFLSSILRHVNSFPML